MSTQKTFKDLRSINVGKNVEKKGNLSYLSWAWAVDTLLLEDPMATWEFTDPKYYGETVMVFCSVTALGKTLKMHLPVMDNYNKAIVNPDARKISDAMMRCLTKCIACFGIGLYIYAGEDLPQDESGNKVAPHQPAVGEVGQESTTYFITFGKFKGKTLEQVGVKDLANYVDYIENKAVTDNKAIGGQVKEFVDRASEFIASFENGT